MASVGSPSETREYVLERLVGEVGDPERVIGAARAMAERAVPAIADALCEALSVRFELEVGQIELARLAATRPESESHAMMVVAASATSPDALMIVLDGLRPRWSSARSSAPIRRLPSPRSRATRRPSSWTSRSWSSTVSPAA